jgi:hypothetical protein
MASKSGRRDENPTMVPIRFREIIKLQQQPAPLEFLSGPLAVRDGHERPTPATFS